MRPSEKWSVRFLLDEETARALTDTQSWGWPSQVSSMSVGGWHGDALDPEPYVTFELDASGPEGAEGHARKFVDQARRAAGLPRRRLTVVWVAPLREQDQSSHRFLEQARDLFGSEQYELAIVAAQIHFELQVRLLMERAATRIGKAWAKRLTKNPRVAMFANDVSTAAAELLLQIDVTQQSLWPAYKLHLSRRNAVVHEGAVMARKEAQESIDTVRRFWAELAKVERPTTLF